MRIGIITDSIEWGPVSVGNYTMNLVENLVEIAKEDMEFVLIHRQKDNNPIYKKTEELIFPSPIERVSHSFFPLKVLSFARRQFSEFFYNYKLQLKILNAGIDVVHIPHLAGATAPPLHVPGQAIPTTAATDRVCRFHPRAVRPSPANQAPTEFD